jgi:hypothetical protein
MIKVRAHHLLCIPRFYHGGYDKKFAKNMRNVCNQIRKNEEKIKVISGEPDDLCIKCPHLWKVWKGKCIQSKKIEKWVVSQDKKVLKYLDLKKNSIQKIKDIFNLSMEKANNKKIEKICQGCIFLENCLKVGINNSFKKDINKGKSSTR